jgi:hypothetical protein
VGTAQLGNHGYVEDFGCVVNDSVDVSVVSEVNVSVDVEVFCNDSVEDNCNDSVAVKGGVNDSVEDKDGDETDDLPWQLNEGVEDGNSDVWNDSAELLEQEPLPVINAPEKKVRTRSFFLKATKPLQRTTTPKGHRKDKKNEKPSRKTTPKKQPQLSLAPPRIPSSKTHGWLAALGSNYDFAIRSRTVSQPLVFQDESKAQLHFALRLDKLSKREEEARVRLRDEENAWRQRKVHRFELRFPKVQTRVQVKAKRKRAPKKKSHSVPTAEITPHQFVLLQKLFAQLHASYWGQGSDSNLLADSEEGQLVLQFEPIWVDNELYDNPIGFKPTLEMLTKRRTAQPVHFSNTKLGKYLEKWDDC